MITKIEIRTNGMVYTFDEIEMPLLQEGLIINYNKIGTFKVTSIMLHIDSDETVKQIVFARR